VPRRRVRRDDRLVGLSVRVSREERDAIKARALARGVTDAQLVVGASLELALPDPDAFAGGGELVVEAAGAPVRRPVGEGRAQVNLNLSEAERDELRARAGQRGVSVSALLLNSALERALPAARALVGPQERAVIDRAVGVIDDSIAELGRIGNQFAHVANTTGEVSIERRLRDALDENSDTIGVIRGVADELARSVR